MIDRVLDKRVVLAQAEAVLQQLETPSPGLTIEEADAPEETRQEVIAALREAVSAESVPTLARQDESVRAELTAVERKAYIPANRVLSMVQTAMEEQLWAEHEELLQPSPEATGPGGPAVTALYTGLDDLWKKAEFAVPIGKAVLKRWWRGWHDFVEAPSPPIVDLATDARIVLFGDWGMGNATARKVSDLIRKELLAAGDRHAHVIHLGDVYYTGERGEARKKVLDVWPVKPGDANRWSWALNGNHDMYSGGFGYFETTLEDDDRFAAQRTPDGDGISYFMLRNEHWQFLGLDSAWDFHGWGLHGYLTDAQEAWAKSCVQPADGRRTVLLTHHQFRSDHKTIGGDLAARLKPVIDGPRGVDAWFWGHEHICARFPHNQTGVRYAACVGNGAIPEPVDNFVPPQGGWEYNVGYKDSDKDEWRLCGFAVLDLDGDEIKVRYINEEGESHHPEQLPV